MKVLVTGGGGFLGSRLVELLLAEGHTVRFLARGRYPEVEAKGAEGLQVDLRDSDGMIRAATGCDAVLHVASKAGYWGAYDEFHGINVLGTENVIAACRKAGVGRLLYTSTPSVTGYAKDIEGLASAPYPERWESPYGHTKALAEQAVLGANGPDLSTVSLRPHLIIGPGDNHLIPRVVQRARQKKMAIVGDGRNKVDLTYVDNAAWAHLDAMAALTGPAAACAGKAYFLSNDEPVLLWDWLADFLPRVGVDPVRRRVPLWLAHAGGAVLETVWRTFRLQGEPRMTRFLALALARHHWYDMGPAKVDFGYRIRVDMAEATARTAAWVREQNIGA